MYTLFAEVVPAYLAYMGETSLWSFLLHTSIGWEGGSFLYLMVRDEEGVRWRRELRTSCCGQWWPWVLCLTTHESGSFGGGRSGVVRGVVRLYFQHLFSFVFLLSHRLSLLLFFPRASESRVLPIVGVCLSSSHLHIFSLHIFSSSHLLIFTPSHLHIFSSSHLLTSHLLIFTSSHLHIFSSSHLLISTSSHLHICTSSHLHIFTSSDLHIFSSSQLLILTSSHLHIFSSSHFLIFTSSHLHICSSSHLLILTSSHLHHTFTSSHLHIFSCCPLALLPSCSHLLFYFSSEGGGRGSANETARNATLSHETRFDRPKLR